MKCPTCRRALGATPEEQRWQPFCSERCRSVDLGNWLDASYRIAAPIEQEDLDQGLPTDGAPVPKDPPN
jgi:endogenous inhibitor of DNA gyrase (YacG/DUF329 family)